MRRQHAAAAARACRERRRCGACPLSSGGTMRGQEARRAQRQQMRSRRRPAVMPRCGMPAQVHSRRAAAMLLTAHGRRAEGGEPPARSCASRCARRHAHGRRAQRTARTRRAAAARCGCFVVAWGVGRAQVRGGCSEGVSRGAPTRRQRPPQARPRQRWPITGRWAGSWGSLGASPPPGWSRGGVLLVLCPPMALVLDGEHPWARDNSGFCCAFHAC